MMKYQITKTHTPENDAPIFVKKGEKVKLGKLSTIEDGWLDWIYCYNLNNNTEGWVPIQIVENNGEYGNIITDYSAQELKVEPKEIVFGERELNGWIWCEKSDKSQKGWLPKEVLKEI